MNRIQWETVTVGGSDTQFGRINIYVGSKAALTAKLKLWNINLGDYSKIEIGQSHTDSASMIKTLLEQHGPLDGVGDGLECEFPVAADYIVIQATVDANQQGAGVLSYEVV